MAYVSIVACVASLPAASQTFAVAIPAMEGPITMGIFEEDGRMVRLLCRDAPVSSLPAGLNGLIMTWDEKDEAGLPVPTGLYRARGLVHGEIRADSLPRFQRRTFDDDLRDAMRGSPCLQNGGKITIRAAADELLETRPLIDVTAQQGRNGLTLMAGGLPLVDLPVAPEQASKITITHGPCPGAALVIVDNKNFSETISVDGLERMVPLDAGTLEVVSDAFHPPPVAGESAP